MPTDVALVATQVSLEEDPSLIVAGTKVLVVKFAAGTAAGLTIILILSLTVSPSRSFTVSLNTYVPAVFMLVKLVVRLLGADMVGSVAPDGFETRLHVVVSGALPPLAVPAWPVTELIGRVIARSDPALTVGVRSATHFSALGSHTGVPPEQALTVSFTVSDAFGGVRSVHVNVYTAGDARTRVNDLELEALLVEFHQKARIPSSVGVVAG